MEIGIKLQELCSALECLLDGRMPRPVNSTAENPELQALVHLVNNLFTELNTLTLSAHDLSVGYFHQPISSRLSIGQSLKGLQETLRLVTQQTAQIAAGDFAQRIDLLGEFSKSFNSMAAQLAANQQKLLIQQRQLETLATTDSLTRVANRRHILRLGQMEFNRARRYDRDLSVLQMDLDHFKRINDGFGHAAGDEVLKAVVNVCSENLRETDAFGRTGGEEFVAILVESNPEQARLTAERLCSAVKALAIPVAHATVSLTISIGAASKRQNDENLEAILNRADEALYEAKRRGRDRVIMAQALGPGENATVFE